MGGGAATMASRSDEASPSLSLPADSSGNPLLPPDANEDFHFDGHISNDVELLRQAWINESLSPEVLAYKEELVDRVRSLISSQEQIVEEYEQDHAKALTRMIRFAELNRIKFSLRSYLRKRLSKIEAFAIHIFVNEELSSRLSPQELEFVKEYIDSENRLFQDTILNYLPKDYDSLIHQSEAMETEVPDM